MTILFVSVILIMAAIFHFLPEWTRPDIFFTVTVEPAFRRTEAGRAILKRYRFLVWIWALSCIALRLPARSIAVVEIVPLLGWLGALLLARRQTLRYAAAPDPILEIDLSAPQETLPGGLLAFLLPLGLLVVLALWTVDYTIAGIHAAMCAMLILFAWGILHWSRRIATAGPRAVAERRFRRLCAGYLLVSTWLMSAQAWVLQLKPPAAVQYGWFALMGATIVTFVVLLIRLGQGGSHAALETAAGPPAGDRNQIPAGNGASFITTPLILPCSWKSDSASATRSISAAAGPGR
jgi:hypothetical protein